ncbi:IPT/TIG domain-containing protein [Streptomyces sp. NBC_01497]|uniref:IPT/TIG domain-containing protein n=1 Tax=Streptomyces sp. NBC_01497 TaxID=2903885 RepID=UPI002E36B2DA|nr:IPT/TIG domain-containing protein [Streptomyces sp. NBC_01497]
MNDARSTSTTARLAAPAAGPVLTSVVPSTGPAAGNNTVTLNGSGFAGVTAVAFGSTPALTYTVNSTTKITAVAPPGTGAVAVTVRNPGGTSNPVTYTYAAAPTLTSVSPSQGPASGGTTVVLVGTGLSAATSVVFGATPATTFTVDSSTQITAVAPAGSGAVPITVTTPGGTTGPVFFFYLTAPTLISVTPTQGPASGGAGVTLRGADLTGTTAVLFGATLATTFTVDSPTQLTAVTPPGSGTAPVTVTTPAGSSNSLAYTYVPAPHLSGLSPSQGPLDPGTVITLTGSGLTTTTAVRFGAVPAAFTLLSDATITASVPSGPAGTVLVTVTTSGGTSNSLPYTRVSAPHI